MIGKRIKDLRKRAGLTQKELGEKFFMSDVAVTNWENGKRTPTPETIVELASLFNVSTDYLLGHSIDENTYLIPVLGNVAAGVPISEQADILGYEELDTAWQARGNFFALKIKGNSMFPDLKEGDTIIVKEQEDIENGQIGVVQVNGDEHTVKKVKISDGGITLIPLNINDFEPVFYDCDEVKMLPVKILGVVAEVRRRFL